MKKTSVYLTDEEADQLRALARATGRPQSELIREGIRKVLSKRPRRQFQSMAMGRSGDAGAGPRHWNTDDLLRRRTGRS